MSSIQCTVCNLELPSRNKLFAHIRSAHSSENQQSVGSINKNDDNVDLSAALSIVYEDDSCRVVVKPQGLATMGQNGLTLFTHPSLQLVGCTRRKAIPCHRLDAATGGLLICSKTKESETMIKQCFRFKWVQKKYLAMVMGKVEPCEGEFTTPIKGKAARSRYQVISHTRSIQGDWITTLALWPVTGRKHQLRKHLNQAGHPILGDKRYSPAATWPSEHSSMYLWAVALDMPHPNALYDLFKKYDLFEQQVLGKRTRPTSQQDITARKEPSSSGRNDEDVLDNGDGESDDDNVDSLQWNDAQHKEVVDALESLPRLSLTIPEPDYFVKTRELRAAAWEQSKNSNTITEE
eukprot:scaffold659_cov192-Ochromonas_danica.AAC.26